MAKRRPIIWTLVSFVLVYKVSNVKCSSFYATDSRYSRFDWQSARRYCSDTFNGSLLSIDTPKAILDYVTTSSGDIWTNAYFSLSPWIIYKGCFDNTKIAAPEFYHIIPNEPKAETMGSCFQSCLEVKTPYFGIQGKTCFCVTSLQHFVKNESKCNLSCDNKLAKCGGTDAISIFESRLPSKDDIHEDRQCATVTCDQGDNHVYRAHKCSNRFKALCGNGDISLAKQPFKGSKQFCNQRNSEIVSDDVDHLCRETVIDNVTQYWVDLHRYPIGPFLADISDNEVYPFTCAKYSNGSFEQESCKKEQDFLCVVDITEKNADLVCTDSNRNHVDGFTIESSRVVNVTMETICQRVQPVYMKYLTYSGVIGLAVSGGLVFLGCCIVSLICCSKKTKKPAEKQHTEMTKVQYSPVKKTNDV
uniref:Uncharacterized protein LOC111125285 n=1 Tax=Crassostrea virginica TaxID=6565 RepID=A0A8B8DCD0_CRAVI|nr:uncharacterized protein LOC111125285 [Crassostrea virginica]